MGEIKIHHPVKLIIGFIYNDHVILLKVKKNLEKKFGKADFESQVIPFIQTTYYNQEIGPDLKRIFLSFRKLILPQNLAQIKIYTNKIEKKMSRETKRQINLDPGYLDFAKLVLATTKDYKHRIYLGRGIFAETTLSYQNNTFQAWEWTYPDYKTDAYLQIFNQIRQNYLRQIKKLP